MIITYKFDAGWRSMPVVSREKAAHLSTVLRLWMGHMYQVIWHLRNFDLYLHYFQLLDHREAKGRGIAATTSVIALNCRTLLSFLLNFIFLIFQAHASVSKWIDDIIWTF